MSSKAACTVSYPCIMESCTQPFPQGRSFTFLSLWFKFPVITNEKRCGDRKCSFSSFLSQVSASRVNDRHGWQVQCNEPLQFMSLHIPEENRWNTISCKHTQTHKSFVFFMFLTPCLFLLARSVDILELSEQQELLKFHYHTLRLYSAICALGNNRVAHALCSHVDESQLLQAIENKYMPGN